MSPILVRPVREQFEHDRVIRVLQARYKRKFEVAINPGAEQNASVEVGTVTMYPDLVLFGLERNRKLQGTVEVETTESINTLEAQAEWGPFSRLRAPFFLYVPVNSIDTVRRLCSEHAIRPAEIWTYHAAIDQVRFTMVHRSPEAEQRARAEKARAEAPPAERADRTEKAEKAGPERATKSDKPKAEKGVQAPAARPAAKTKAVKGKAEKGKSAAKAKPARPAAPPKKPARAAARKSAAKSAAARKSAARKPAKRR